MEIRDFNGVGRWSREGINRTYEEYVKLFKVKSRSDLKPLEHIEGDVKWFYPVMYKVIEGIKEGDKACIQIGVDFIQEDQKFPFGKVLKANTARSLRQSNLSEQQKQQVRNRVVEMLINGIIPREFREYSKLLKKLGLDESLWEKIEKQIDKDNKYVMRYYEYLKS